MSERAAASVSQAPAKGGAVAVVAAHLKRSILSGLLVPGQRLIEADITTDLGVSRSTVREAFRQLSADGLTETITNRGTVVKRISRREMFELYEIRLALESLAAANAAALIGEPGHRLEMQAFADRLARDHSGYSRDDFFQENWDFHVLVARISGNAKLCSLLQQLQTPMILFRANRDLSHKTSLGAVQEHLSIARSIIEGDAAQARAAMNCHLENSLERLPVPGARFSTALGDGTRKADSVSPYLRQHDMNQD